MQKMHFAADYKFDTARKILKLIHRSFRFEDEDQYQLTHFNYLLQLDYMQYKDDNMKMFWDEFQTRMVACTDLKEDILRPILQRQMMDPIGMKEDMDKWEEETVWMDTSTTADPATNTRNPAASSHREALLR